MIYFYFSSAISSEISSPVIILPLRDGQDCWVLNLGDLQIETDGSLLLPDLEESLRALERYKISLRELKFEYYPTQEFFREYYQKQQLRLEEPVWRDTTHYPGRYQLLRDVNMELAITLVKANYLEKVAEDVASMKIDGRLPDLTLQLRKVYYQKVLRLGDCFSEDPGIGQRTMSVRSLSVDDIQLERKRLMGDAHKIGMVHKRGDTLKTWDKKYVILSRKGHIYFFDGAKDELASSHYYVRRATVELLDESSVGKPFAVRIKNKYTDLVVAFDKAEIRQQWVQMIEQLAPEQEQRVRVAQEAPELQHQFSQHLQQQ